MIYKRVLCVDTLGAALIFIFLIDNDCRARGIVNGSKKQQIPARRWGSKARGILKKKKNTSDNDELSELNLSIIKRYKIENS